MYLGLHCCQELGVFLQSGEGSHSNLISGGSEDDIFGIELQGNPIGILGLQNATIVKTHSLQLILAKLCICCFQYTIMCV